MEVEQAALGALQQDRIAPRQRLLDDREDVLDVRAKAFAVCGVLGEHRLRVEWRHMIELLKDRVLDLVQDESELLLEEARLQQIARAEPHAPALVAIAGTLPPPPPAH